MATNYNNCTIVKAIRVGTPIRSISSGTVTSFGDIGNIRQAAVTLTTTSTNQLVDSFDASTANIIEYLTEIQVDGKVQGSKLLVIHDGSVARVTEYGVIRTDGDLGDFAVAYQSGTPDAVHLNFTPHYANTTVKITRIFNE